MCSWAQTMLRHLNICFSSATCCTKWSYEHQCDHQQQLMLCRTLWTFVSQNHSTRCTVTCMVHCVGALLFDKVYVHVLRQVYQRLPGVLNVSSIPSFKNWIFRNGNVVFDVISHLTPHPTLRIPHMHAHICMCRTLSQLWQCAVFGVLIRSTGPDSFSGVIPWLVCHG